MFHESAPSAPVASPLFSPTPERVTLSPNVQQPFTSWMSGEKPGVFHQDGVGMLFLVSGSHIKMLPLIFMSRQPHHRALMRRTDHPPFPSILPLNRGILMGCVPVFRARLDRHVVLNPWTWNEAFNVYSS